MTNDFVQSVPHSYPISLVTGREGDSMSDASGGTGRCATIFSLHDRSDWSIDLGEGVGKVQAIRSAYFICPLAG